LRLCRGPAHELLIQPLDGDQDVAGVLGRGSERVAARRMAAGWCRNGVVGFEPVVEGRAVRVSATEPSGGCIFAGCCCSLPPQWTAAHAVVMSNRLLSCKHHLAAVQWPCKPAMKQFGRVQACATVSGGVARWHAGCCSDWYGRLFRYGDAALLAGGQGRP
jgi:hypothetical protein